MLCLFLIMLSIYFDLIDAHEQFIFRFDKPKLNAKSCRLHYMSHISNCFTSSVKNLFIDLNNALEF